MRLSLGSHHRVAGLFRCGVDLKDRLKATNTAVRFVCLLVGCLTSQHHSSVCQGRICSDNFTCCHTEIEVANQTFYLTLSHYTDTGQTRSYNARHLLLGSHHRMAGLFRCGVDLKDRLKAMNTAVRFVCLLVGCLTSQQHASVSQGRICSDNFTCCHTEIEVADQIFYLTKSQYIDTRLTSPSTDPITQGVWQGSHWSANFQVTGMTRPRTNPGASRIRNWDLLLLKRTP